MPISTIAELFLAGGQHVVESYLERKPFSIAGVQDVLRRHFGQELTVPDASVEGFAFQVREAMFAARTINRFGTIDPADIPRIAGGERGYSYTTLVSVADPVAPEDDSRRVTVPLTIPSAEPLSLEQIRAYVDELLAEWQPDRETAPGGAADDLLRRDAIIRRFSTEVEGGLGGLASTDVFAVYRRV